jgi:CubicO group peptidase (beta-lactamase class C family)
VVHTQAGGAPISGWTSPGFEPVRAAFEANFAAGRELGAACAAYVDGAPVVDLWGGFCDVGRREPWRQDTMVPVFSTTKGMASMAIAVSHSRGLFDYGAPVASYWPEFARNGKSQVTVRQLLAHQAGLSAIDEPISLQKARDLDALAAAIAPQRPAWEPGTRHGYHGITIGFYEGELLRRVDPRHRSLGRYFQEEVAAPLGASFHIGVPASVPDARIAELQAFRPAAMLLHLNSMPAGMVLAVMNPRSLTARSLNPLGLRRPAELAAPENRDIELGAGGGVGETRAIAKIYSDLATGGRALGLRPETLAALAGPASAPSRGIRDVILHMDTSFSLGFWKPFPAFRFGTAEGTAFGTPGLGGSFGFADPAVGLGFAYAPNRLGFRMWDDPREKTIRDAVYRCLAAVRPSRTNTPAEPWVGEVA